MKSAKHFAGAREDLKEGLSLTGNIVRDAWVFDLLPETQDCAGWSVGQIDDLYEKVSNAWEPYGHLVSGLPEELREKHKRIYDEAIAIARDNGWDPNAEDALD
ncbi:MAG: hypothetical protein ACWA5Q_10465 [bacterium]